MRRVTGERPSLVARIGSCWGTRSEPAATSAAAASPQPSARGGPASEAPGLRAPAAAGGRRAKRTEWRRGPREEEGPQPSSSLAATGQPKHRARRAWLRRRKAASLPAAIVEVQLEEGVEPQSPSAGPSALSCGSGDSTGYYSAECISLGSISQQSSRPPSMLGLEQMEDYDDDEYSPDIRPDSEPPPASTSALLASCLPSLLAPSKTPSRRGVPTASQAGVSPPDQAQLPVGGSVPRLTAGMAGSCAGEAWSQPDGSSFNVRGVSYTSDKKKVSSAPALYELLGVDVFSSCRKIPHVARFLRLSDAAGVDSFGPEVSVAQLPRFLVINIQIPIGTPSIFGEADGVGHNVVIVFSLPAAALAAMPAGQRALFERFHADGVEADGQPTRERLKFIPHIDNTAYVFEHLRLGRTEKRLIQQYDSKPVLTRPQHRYFRGRDYLEVRPARPARLCSPAE